MAGRHDCRLSIAGKLNRGLRLSDKIVPPIAPVLSKKLKRMLRSLGAIAAFH